MDEIHSQSLHAGESWKGGLTRGAGLYGELQPMPLPVVAPASSVRKRKPRPKGSLSD